VFNYESSWVNVYTALHSPPLSAEIIDSPTVNGAANVNIDNKIEQAMDLVKTHLMFAVREEVEQMRVQIADLERKLVVLEAENTMLRQHLPHDVVTAVLQKMQTVPLNTN